MAPIKKVSPEYILLDKGKSAIKEKGCEHLANAEWSELEKIWLSNFVLRKLEIKSAILAQTT